VSPTALSNAECLIAAAPAQSPIRTPGRPSG
jgi:hypothetical protein